MSKKISEVMNDVRRVDSRRDDVLYCDDPSLTHQEFAAECDIRTIMNKYKRTGIVTHLTSAKEMLGDFTDVPDYRESLDAVIRAQEAFDSLPAELRAKFQNDPALFLDHVNDPKNYDDVLNFGLTKDVQVDTKTDATAEAGPSST